MSILGSLGPLVQGPSQSRRRRVRDASLFAGAFLAGACFTFWGTDLLGGASGVQDLPGRWRAGLAGTGLLLLAGVDLAALRRGVLFPLGWRRQTPRVLMRRYSVPVVLSVWGFDTGLVLTTFRVAAVSWAAVVLTGLGFSAWWAGIGYGLGFAIPFSFLLWAHPVGRAARAPTATDPGLEAMLERRTAIQALSAALLLAGAVAFYAGAMLRP